MEKRPESRRIYRDDFSGIEFEINVPLNLSDIIAMSKNNAELHKRYSNFIVDGTKYVIENEVIDMCYRCTKFVVNPKLEMEDWLLISLNRGDLIIAINAEIADMMLSSVNSIAQSPLASIAGMALSENSMQ